MKNNIIIAGVPRAEKSTISHRLAKRYGYQHMSMDSIIAGFKKSMLDSGEYDEFEPGMALDIYQLLSEDYMKYIHGANCEIFYFLTSDVTPEERFAIHKNPSSIPAPLWSPKLRRPAAFRSGNGYPSAVR